jgi:hypothetical protein
MSFPTTLDIARGIPGGRVVRQFGRNTAVVGTFAPIARGGIYRTPQVGSATTLRIKSGGNANDTAAGTGARAVTLIGLDANGDLISDTVATAGASESSPTTKQFIRLFEAFVSASGTYATQSAQSHAASIVIENGAGGTDWATIPDTDIPRGEAEIGAFSVPRNRTLLISNVRVQVGAGNKTNLVMFKRENILQTAAPYSGMLLIEEFPTVEGVNDFVYDPPIRMPALTDYGFLGKSDSGTIDVCVAFEGVEVIPT